MKKLDTDFSGAQRLLPILWTHVCAHLSYTYTLINVSLVREHWKSGSVNKSSFRDQEVAGLLTGRKRAFGENSRDFKYGLSYCSEKLQLMATDVWKHNLFQKCWHVAMVPVKAVFDLSFVSLEWFSRVTL